MNLITRKAVLMALAGTALAVGASAASASNTMYNMNNFGGLNSNTDGWVWSDPANTALAGGTAPTTANPAGVAPTVQAGAAGPNRSAVPYWNSVAGGNFVNYASPTRASNFVGTAPGTTPFGFNATSSLNWGISLSGVGDSGVISKNDSLARYGVSAEIDTGAGAWQDNTAVATTTNTTTGVTTTTAPTGWKHQTDIGLLQVDQDMVVSLAPAVLPGGAALFVGNFGITVFDGMDSSTATYSHHGRWNSPGYSVSNSTVTYEYTKSDPFGTIGLNYLTHSGTVDANNPLSFLALAGHTYSIYIGGAGVGSWGANLADYQLGVTTSAVPVPGAIWLLGSALAGMGMVGRRKEKASA